MKIIKEHPPKDAEIVFRRKYHTKLGLLINLLIIYIKYGDGEVYDVEVDE